MEGSWVLAAAPGGHVVVLDAAGDILVTGDYFGAVDFGTGPLPGASDGDMFLVRFGPTGRAE